MITFKLSDEVNKIVYYICCSNTFIKYNRLLNLHIKYYEKVLFLSIIIFDVFPEWLW